MRLLKPLALVLLVLLYALLIGMAWLLISGRTSGSNNQILPTRLVMVAIPTDAALQQVTAALPPTFTPVRTQEEMTSFEENTEPFTPTPVPAAIPMESTTTPEAQSPAPTETLTSAPTVAPLLPTGAAAAGTATPVPSAHACRDPVPDPPNYARYFLSDRVWPAPEPGVPLSHFAMAKPFPGEGRFLINQDYPYGSDLSGRLLLHNGVDAAEPKGTPLLAVADGTIIVAREDWNEQYGWRCDWYGHLVVLQLDQTWLGQPIFALYGHVLGIRVEEGQRVARGEPVAEVGLGGAATVAHLHFEVRIGANEFGSTRNPMLWINPATRGVIAGRLVDPSGRPWQGVGLSLVGKFEDASDGNTWSYLADPLEIVNIHPDEGAAENFVFADVKPGPYDVYTLVQGVEYRAAVTVYTGQVSTVEIVTEMFKTPTP